MSLPRGAMSWSVVCDRGIYKSYTLAFCSQLAWKETAGYFTLCYNCRVAVCVLCLFLAVTCVGLWTLIVAFMGHTCFLRILLCVLDVVWLLLFGVSFQGAVCLYEICDRGISWSFSLICFLLIRHHV